MEEWKKIPNYEKYEVSTLGNIRSFCISGSTESKEQSKLLKPKLTKDGYLRVTLCNQTGKKEFNIHRLVCLTFLPNPENKPDVDHINRIRTDNRLENLRWATKSENSLNKIFKTNTGEPHITLTLRYDVSFRKDKRKIFSKSFKTLEEAIKARDEFILKEINPLI